MSYRVAFFAIGVAYLVTLFGMFVSGQWLWDAQGHLVPTDFVNVYAAGKLALSGHAPSVYDWPSHLSVEVTLLGPRLPTDQYYAWHYPPLFLPVAALLALLPYQVAFLSWGASTLAIYLFVAWRMLPSRSATLLAAFAFPPTFYNLMLGQNGLASAMLVGGTLLTLERRPWLSGFILGLLTFKPQLGVLFPLALALGGHWRTILAAAATSLALAAMTLVLWGSQAWIAFVHSVPASFDVLLAQGLEGWEKVDSIYGFARWAGMQQTGAWLVQATLFGLAATGVAVLWKSDATRQLKYAGLATASLLATPYLYIYDLQTLAVAIGFLERDASLDTRERVVVIVGAVMMLAGPVAHAPTGLFAVMSVAVLIILRACRGSEGDRQFAFS
ncbi:MAG TPA: glycosyltransferase family 87 protein [Rhizomicrobium sp.]